MKGTGLIIGAILFCLTKVTNAQQDSVWTLDRCISYALERNIQVRKGELSKQRFQYYADQAKAQRFTSLNASVSHNFNWTRSNSVGQTGYTGANGSNVSINSGVMFFVGKHHIVSGNIFIVLDIIFVVLQYIS